MIMYPSIGLLIITGMNWDKTTINDSWLVVWNTFFFHTLGMSSSQLTKTYFSEGLATNHQPGEDWQWLEDGSSTTKSTSLPFIAA